MQGLQALDQFKNFVSKIGGLGRYEDTYMVHAAEGETVVPMEVLDRNPLLKKRLFKTMMDMGIEPGRYIVGNELNSKNPVTGQPEFFLKKIVSQIRKAMPGDSEKYLGTIAGLATGNPLIGAIAGGIGSGVGGALTGGGAGYFSPGLSGLRGLRGTGDGILGALTGGGKAGASSLAEFLMGRAGDQAAIDQGFGMGDPVKGIIPRIVDYGKDVASKYADTIGIGKTTQGIEKGKFSLTDLLKMGIPMALAVKLLGDAIGPAEDIRIDPSMIDNTPRTDASFANITGPVTRDTSYLSAITPYAAADGGIVKMGLGGFLKSFFMDPVKDPKSGEGTVSTIERKKFEMLQSLKDSDLDYDEEEYLRLKEKLGKADGGIMDLRDGGESMGPGTGTSDSIPAMLSDGEFVMTAKAVRGAGGGDRREGAKKMYEAMDRLEARA
jgi:hypothetical protein